MGYIPIGFKLERLGFMPMIRATGVCEENPIMEKFLISEAVKIIERAERNKGKTLQLKKGEFPVVSKGLVAVTFLLIFPREEDLYKLISEVEEGLG